MQIQNYTLIKQRVLPELHATGYLYEHDKTKARVLYIQTPEDDNKVFSISFATIPENDCGIPHILEHCVLNGSEKYPVKEPFVDLLKGSLNTFLNAMTFPDKTMFPVASRNDKDFMNLMSVYLDAVFYPNLKKDPFIFRQEGWHHELQSEEGDIVYKGVVYNEMKGAFSSGDTVLELAVNRELYPGSVYQYESGGDPDAIPSLTYEEFRAFHDKFYHPCNSFIFFYGNGDPEQHMGFVDREYLQRFDAPLPGQRAEIVNALPLEAPVEICGTYGVSEEDDLSRKTYLSYNVKLDPVRDVQEYFVLDILSAILGGSEASPMKLALLKAGIGQEIDTSISLYLKEPKFTVTARNADPQQKEKFVRIVRDVLKDIAENGFDSKLVESTISSNLFSLREANMGSLPKGIMYAIQCMDRWLYGGDPMEIFGYEDIYAAIKKDTSVFASYVKDHILNNPHRVVAVLAPEAGLNAKTEAKIRQTLKEYKDSLTEEQVRELVASTENMIRRQQEPDSPEDLAKLPMLTREDLKEIEPFKTAEECIIGGIPSSVYKDSANHIVYLTLGFNMDHVPAEKIPYVSLLSDLMGSMNTAARSYVDLDNEIGCHMGGMNISTSALHKLDDSFIPRMNVSAKFLSEETEKALEIIREVLLTTDFSDINRFREILDEEIAGMEDGMMQSGNRTATSRVLSYFSAYNAYIQKISGIDYYRFLKDIRESLKTDAPAVLEQLKETADIILRTDNLRIRLTLDEENLSPVSNKLEVFLKELPAGSSPLASPEVVRFVPEKKNEGFITPAKVQYVAEGGETAIPYSGHAAVLLQITRLNYLWNQVRVMGGAYGCSATIDRHGRITMSSYRDPNLAETLQVYEKSGEVLSAFEADEQEMLKYIIGTLAGLDPVMTVSMKGTLANDALETGLTGEHLLKSSREVLSTTPEDVRKAAAAFTEAMGHHCICVVGSETKIRENAHLLDHVETLF